MRQAYDYWQDQPDSSFCSCASSSRLVAVVANKAVPRKHKNLFQKFIFGLVFSSLEGRKSHFKKDLFNRKRDPNQVPFRHQIVLSTICVELVGISLFIARLYRIPFRDADKKDCQQKNTRPCPPKMGKNFAFPDRAEGQTRKNIIWLPLGCYKIVWLFEARLDTQSVHSQGNHVKTDDESSPSRGPEKRMQMVQS